VRFAKELSKETTSVIFSGHDEREGKARYTLYGDGNMTRDGCMITAHFTDSSKHEGNVTYFYKQDEYRVLQK
jgi:hypothetical protein